MMEAPKVFSCDLVAECRKHISFLERLHERRVTLSESWTLAVSIQRYLDCWMPLVAAAAAADSSGSGTNPRILIPPPDVAWLWHCHRLAPAKYEAYSLHRFGSVLEASPPFSFQGEHEDSCSQATEEEEEDDDEAKTRAAWREAYPQEPFFLQLQQQEEEKITSDDSDNNNNNTQESSYSCILNGFNLVASSKCQADFLWQISGPRFRDEEFLKEGVVNYYKFLRLENTPSDDDKSTSSSLLPLVPTYQIDLMWHTHILVSSSDYQRDCVQIRGKPFHHDDSLNDRTPGGTLAQAFHATVQQWEKAYPGQDYVVPGGMYRGEPPAEYYNESGLLLACNQADDDDRIMTELLAGSSSIGTNAQIGQWCDPRYDEGHFIPAEPKRRNKPRTGHVFGHGSAGLGYYSIDTKDAYQILAHRLRERASSAKSELDMFDFMNCLCCMPTTARFREREVLENKWQELSSMTAFALAMCDAAGPKVVPEKKTIVKYFRSSRTTQDMSTDSALTSSLVWMDKGVPTTRLCNAGGCGGAGGGEVGHIAGPGGGGCGGGGCGGGGCGGGGCGG